MPEKTLRHFAKLKIFDVLCKSLELILYHSNPMVTPTAERVVLEEL